MNLYKLQNIFIIYKNSPKRHELEKEKRKRFELS